MLCVMRFYFTSYGPVDMELLIFIHNFSTNDDDDDERWMEFVFFFSLFLYFQSDIFF